MIEDDLRAFLDEDGVGWRDVTSDLVAGHRASARIVSREDGVAAGVREAVATFDLLGVAAQPLRADGEAVAAGETVIEASGPAEALLRAERLACNLLGSMSGVATRTRRCVDRAAEAVTAPADAPRIAATRKTTPGYRSFEKRAVRVGGGDPHRYDLADAVLIKENHLAVLDVDEAVGLARERASFTATIEVEAETREEAERAAAAGADAVLLDNMTPAECGTCVDALGDADVTVEASGGITPETVADYATTGVDVLSMGSLTYGASWLDVSMLVESVE